MNEQLQFHNWDFKTCCCEEGNSIGGKNREGNPRSDIKALLPVSPIPPFHPLMPLSECALRIWFVSSSNLYQNVCTELALGTRVTPCCGTRQL